MIGNFPGKWAAVSVVVATLLIAASGCEGESKFYQADGKVLLNQEPLEGAQVTFAYTNGNFAHGITDRAGNFQLTYLNRPGGVPAGECEVTIAKRVAVTGIVVPASMDAVPKSESEYKSKYSTMKSQMEEFARKQEEIDAAGGEGDFVKSGMIREIKADKDGNHFVFDFKD